MMDTPIFEQLKTDHRFDPLENVEYESVTTWGGSTVREIPIWTDRDFPVYKAGQDPYGYWAVLRGQPVGDSFFVYQPYARLATWEDATAYAALLNGDYA